MKRSAYLVPWTGLYPNTETTMQKVIYINPDKYTGCLQCEMASKLHLARQLVAEIERRLSR